MNFTTCCYLWVSSPTIPLSSQMSLAPRNDAVMWEWQISSSQYAWIAWVQLGLLLGTPLWWRKVYTQNDLLQLYAHTSLQCEEIESSKKIWLIWLTLLSSFGFLVCDPASKLNLLAAFFSATKSSSIQLPLDCLSM